MGTSLRLTSFGCTFHSDSSELRMEYCYKKNIYYCVENPSSSLLWVYHPMEVGYCNLSSKRMYSIVRMTCV